MLTRFIGKCRLRMHTFRFQKTPYQATFGTMKRGIMAFITGLVLLGTSGCVSTYVVKRKVLSHQEYDAVENKVKTVQGNPTYCALLPLTIAGDVVTSPLQLIYFGWSGDLWIDGWPIPLP